VGRWVGAGGTQLVGGEAKLAFDHVGSMNEFVEWGDRGRIVWIGIRCIKRHISVHVGVLERGQPRPDGSF